MKQFLKLFSVAICVCCFVQCKTDAQALTKDNIKNSTPEQRAKFLTDTMTSILNLNTDQQQKVYNINFDVAKKVQVVMQGDDGRMSKFKQIKSLQNERDSSFKTILSTDQFSLYKQKADAIKQKMREQYNNKKNNQ